MTERVNSSAAKPTWRKTKAKLKNGTFTENDRVMLRFMQNGKRKTISKTFPDMKLDTERKRQLALNKWIKEFEEEQEATIAAEEAERLVRNETERAAAKKRRRNGSGPTPRPSAPSSGTTSTKQKKGQAGTTDSGIEGSTIADHNRTARKIEPFFSGVPITEITPEMVRDWESDQLDAGMSPNNVGKCHRLLNAACKEAVVMGLIAVNPVTAVKAPKRMQATPNSLERMQMREVTERRLSMEPTPLVTGAFIALHLGLRMGEVCGLRWYDVSFEKDGLYVRQSIGTGQGGTYVKKPKSVAGERFVPFDSDLTVKVLKRRRAYMVAKCNDLPVDMDQAYVIGNPCGRVHPYACLAAISKQWAALSDMWGLTGTQGRRVTFHDLRHLSVTAAIEASGDGAVESIAANHGHSDVTMTLNVYGSATSTGKRLAAHAAGEHTRPVPRPRKEADVPPLATHGHDRVDTYMRANTLRSPTDHPYAHGRAVTAAIVFRMGHA